MSRETLSKSETYINRYFVKDDLDLVRVREALKVDGKFGINVSGAEGKFLQFLVGVSRAKTIVEIGVLYGYSTLWMAKGLPADGTIIAIEKDKKNFDRASELIKNSNVSSKIHLINGDAREVLPQIGLTPDLIFIDADKSNYRHYLDWAMKAINVGGVIIGDNTFLFGHLIDEDRGEKTSPTAIESMKYFNETLAAAPNFRSIMVPTYEG
ncbi:MAG: O-methyltransferase, partial [Bdellovibrionales bacterium]|nr:O-methyltransferase [Bdellovibrionales bacterium]